MFTDIINSPRASEKWRKQVLNGMYSLCCLLYGTPFCCYLRGERRRTYICIGVYTHKEHWKDTQGIMNSSYLGWTFGKGWSEELRWATEEKGRIFPAHLCNHHNYNRLHHCGHHKLQHLLGKMFPTMQQDTFGYMFRTF